jgi:hypothetical protein
MLAARLAAAKPGAFLLTATIQLPSADWLLLEVLFGFDRIVALYHRSSTAYQIH